jgi:hypothetical protein
MVLSLSVSSFGVERIETLRIWMRLEGVVKDDLAIGQEIRRTMVTSF